MDAILLCVIFLVIIGVKVDFGGGYFRTYLRREQAVAVNGIFVLLVILRHFKSYIECGYYDKMFWTLDSYLDQLIVTTFLFYSGYGIMISLKNKQDYVHRIPKRVLQVWARFAMALCLYLVLDLAFEKTYDFGTLLLSFTGWKSIGNSNWYIFAILFLYITSYFAAIIYKDNYLRMIINVLIGCVLYIMAMILAHKGNWFYSTILCFPLGMLYGEYQKWITEVLSKGGVYVITLGILLFSFILFYIGVLKLPKPISIVLLELRGVIFVLLIVIITMHIKVGNPILDWLGKYTFEIYILQRLPMIALSDICKNKYVYFMLSISITFLIAPVFRKITGFILNAIMENK